MVVHPFVSELFVDEVELLGLVDAITVVDLKAITMFVIEDGLSYEAFKTNDDHGHLLVCFITDYNDIIHEVEGYFFEFILHKHSSFRVDLNLSF